MDEQAFSIRFAKSYQSQYNGEEPTNFTSLDFVGSLGCISDALLYSKLFLPDLIEIEGMVLLKDFVEDAGGPESVRQLLAEGGGDPTTLEKRVNCLQINLSFPVRRPQDIAGDDHLLARELATSWTLILQKNYPDRRFMAQVLDEDGEASVYFYQIR